MSTGWLERCGSLIAAGGLIWGVKRATENFTTLANLALPTGGPLELCAIGVLIWLYAKYRRSVVAH